MELKKDNSKSLLTEFASAEMNADYPEEELDLMEAIQDLPGVENPEEQKILETRMEPENQEIQGTLVEPENQEIQEILPNPEKPDRPETTETDISETHENPEKPLRVNPPIPPGGRARMGGRRRKSKASQ